MQLKEDLLFHDRYQLIRLLGRGGFSEVWLAEDSKTQLKIALKVYAPGTGLDEDGIELFRQQFALVFNFNHTNLLRPMYYDLCDRIPYLTMPYCEQGSVLKAVGRISEAEAWKFLHDVAAGLAYLHAQDPPVIHKDIKPDNILMDTGGTYLITDFGISTKVRSTLRRSVGPSQRPDDPDDGTLAYMGPERFSKNNAPVKAGDIWSLGASVYELLVGDPPFGDHGGLLLLSGAEIPNIEGSWSPELKRIIHLCLQKETWDRPKAGDLVDWTERHFRNEPLRIGNAETKEKKEKLKKTIRDHARHISRISRKYTRLGMYILAGVILAGILVFSLRNGSDGENKIETPGVELEVIVPQKPQWRDEYDRIVNLAKSYAGKGSYSEAKAEYKKALRSLPGGGDLNAEEEIKALIADCDKQMRDEYDRIVNLAKSYDSKGNYSAAKAEYTKALLNIPDGEDRNAEEEIKTLIANCDKQITAAIDKALKDANTAFASAKYKEAFNYYKRAKDMGSKDTTGYTNYLNLSKKLIELAGYDDNVKQLLQYARQLNKTKEVETLLSHCK
ncbi:MAG: protein kinase [Tannerella sp.]|nr:protein kinase [Tannerella sp.]